MKRHFFPWSVILGVIALTVHLVARDQMTRYMHQHAVEIAAASQQQGTFTPGAATVRLRDNSRILDRVGLVFAFSCLVCLVVALVRRESGRYSIPIILLLFDTVTELLL